MEFVYLAIGSDVLALLFSFWRTAWIGKQDEGTDKMKSIGKHTQTHDSHSKATRSMSIVEINRRSSNFIES